LGSEGICIVVHIDAVDVVDLLLLFLLLLLLLLRNVVRLLVGEAFAGTENVDVE